MKLEGLALQQLHEALCAAFRGDFERFVAFSFPHSIRDRIPESTALSAQILCLLDEMGNQDAHDHLVRLARRDNPGNERLREFEMRHLGPVSTEQLGDLETQLEVGLLDRAMIVACAANAPVSLPAPMFEAELAVTAFRRIVDRLASAAPREDAPDRLAAFARALSREPHGPRVEAWIAKIAPLRQPPPAPGSPSPRTGEPPTLVPRGQPSIEMRRAESTSRDDLVAISRKLLTLGKPPSLSALFPDAPAAAHHALASLERTRRVLTTNDRAVSPESMIRLVHLPAPYHLVVGPPGSGKTFALWHSAQDLLDDGGPVPLYVALGSMGSWNDVIALLDGVGGGIAPSELLTDTRVCVFLDGWLDFLAAHPSDAVAAMRDLHRTRVIATSRSATASQILAVRSALAVSAATTSVLSGSSPAA